MLTDLTLLEARVDWITVSAPTGDAWLAMAGIGGMGILDEQKRGERLKTFRSLGYDAARAGSWTVAQGETHGYISVGGIDAEHWARALLAYASHCSRLDYCATVRYPTGLDNPVPGILRDLRDRYAGDEREDSIGHYRGLRRDRGITIGKRGSPYYARIYDKSLESHGRYPPASWRFEVELKRHASEFEHAEYQINPIRLEHSGQIVRDHFRRWNVEVPAVHGPTLRMAKQIRRVPDAERALEWLRRQVRPTIEWLTEIGRGDEARAALFEQLAIPE